MNILLVEDEVSLAMIVKDALEEEGYEVAIARDGLARTVFQGASRIDHCRRDDAGGGRLRDGSPHSPDG